VLRYLIIALLILLGLSGLGSAIFGSQTRRRLVLTAFTVIAWGAAALMYFNPPGGDVAPGHCAHRHPRANGHAAARAHHLAFWTER